MSDKTESAADPRPNGEPYYIDSYCNCGAELILYDVYRENTPNEEIAANEYLSDPELEDRGKHIWHDEWICPECADGIHTDWPDRLFDKLKNREPVEDKSIEEILK